MHIVLDIDDTITYAPEFFSVLTHALVSSTVTILTYRADEADARKTLEECGIRYDNLITSTDPEHGHREGERLEEWKAQQVNRLGADLFFEDMPEVIRHVGPSTRVFMSCDHVVRDWLDECLR